MSRPTLLSCRDRRERSAIAMLGDLDRPGRPAVIDEFAVVVVCIEEKTPAQALKQTAPILPMDRGMPVVADNYATDKHPNVTA